jgi:hypothetical protein
MHIMCNILLISLVWYSLRISVLDGELAYRIINTLSLPWHVGNVAGVSDAALCYSFHVPAAVLSDLLIG